MGLKVVNIDQAIILTTPCMACTKNKKYSPYPSEKKKHFLVSTSHNKSLKMNICI